MKNQKLFYTIVVHNNIILYIHLFYMGSIIH